jgi:hypothetical protein
MAMQNPFIQQWIDFNKLAIDSFKKVATNNVDATNQTLKSVAPSSGTAELTLSYVTLFKDVAQVYTDSVNSVFRTQLELMCLETTSNAYQKFWKTYLTSMTDLGKNQVELMKLCVDAASYYGTKLNDTITVDEVATLPNAVLEDLKLKDKLAKNMEETLGIVNGLNRAIDISTKEYLNAIAAEGSKSSS